MGLVNRKRACLSLIAFADKPLGAKHHKRLELGGYDVILKGTQMKANHIPSGALSFNSKIERSSNMLLYMVPKRGLEPPRAKAHYPLKVACLPISPLRHKLRPSSHIWDDDLLRTNVLDYSVSGSIEGISEPPDVSLAGLLSSVGNSSSGSTLICSTISGTPRFRIEIDFCFA
jgi:hypothetical protein